MASLARLTGCLCALVLWSSALSALAQEPFGYEQPVVRFKEPILLLNSTLITHSTGYDDVLTASIVDMQVYKPGAAPKPFTELSLAAPIISVVCKDKAYKAYAKVTKSESLIEIAKRLRLRGPLRYAVNGYPIPTELATRLRIAQGGIGQLHIVQPTATEPDTRLDIWLAPAPEKTYPPGTILIRGLAAENK